MHALNKTEKAKSYTETQYVLFRSIYYRHDKYVSLWKTIILYALIGHVI